MGITSIEWTDYSWNPWVGCSKVSTGCEHCWAENILATRFKKVEWGKGKDRKRTSPYNWTLPLKWNQHATDLVLGYKVFISSCDPFDVEVPDDWRYDLFELISKTPNLTWLLLTKRPREMRGWFQVLEADENPSAWYPNIWLGVSAENQKTADERIPILRSMSGVPVRFVSYEPALEEVDFARASKSADLPMKSNIDRGPVDWIGGINWIIGGAESGPKARPFDVQWMRSMIAQCRSMGIAPFVKQLGKMPWDSSGKLWGDHADGIGSHMIMKSSKGGKMDEWPEDLRVREFPVPKTRERIVV